MNDDWYEQFGLVNAEIDFDLHIDKDDFEFAPEIVDGVKNINIHSCKVEFGFEEDLDNKEYIVINLGFIVIKVKRKDFEEALKHFRLRDIGNKELKR